MSEHAKLWDRVYVHRGARYITDEGLSGYASKSVRGRYGTVVGVGDENVTVRPDDHPEDSLLAGWYVQNVPAHLAFEPAHPAFEPAHLAFENDEKQEPGEEAEDGIELTTRIVVEVYAGDELIGRIPWPDRKD